MTIKEADQKEIQRVLETLEDKTNMDNIVGQLVGELGRNKSMELIDHLVTAWELLQDQDDAPKEQTDYEKEHFPMELKDSLDKIVSYLY